MLQAQCSTETCDICGTREVPIGTTCPTCGLLGDASNWVKVVQEQRTKLMDRIYRLETAATEAIRPMRLADCENMLTSGLSAAHDELCMALGKEGISSGS